MNLWGHCFSQNANQKLQGFPPYQTNKDCTQKTAYNHQKITKKKVLRSLFVWLGRNPCNFGWHFGRNDDLINLFWTNWPLCTSWILITTRLIWNDFAQFNWCENILHVSGLVKVNLEFSFSLLGFSFSGLDPNIYLGFKPENHFILQFQFFSAIADC